MITQNRKDMFETFSDGTCSIHRIDDDGNAGESVERLRYRERTVGIHRYYEAMTAKVQIDRLLRIPYRDWVTTEYLVVLGSDVYEIKQVQVIPDTLPKANDLSLRLSRQRRVADGTV